MTTDDEISRVLEEARVDTTPEQDARILDAAGKALRRPTRRWFPVAAAAATLLVLAAGAAALFLSDRDEPERVLASSAPTKLFSDEEMKLFVTNYSSSEVTVLDLGEVSGGNGTAGHLMPEGSRNWSPDDFNDSLTEIAWGPASNALFGATHPNIQIRLGHSGEDYDAVEGNPFLDPRRAPLSTFSIDVDTASYANVRRILDSGALPPAGAVRIEEMVNYFSYDYPPPEGGAPFSVTTEVAECPWDPGHRLVHVGIQGRRIAEEQVPPRNLVFLLDVSGSMRPADKLPLVKAALRLLVERLRREDRISVVVYAGASGVVLDPTAGDRQQEILAAVDRLGAGGSTNAGEGIVLAYALARRHFDTGAINRVILATDGDFNVGITNRSDLKKLIEKEREGGVFLTVLGVGTGNLKDSQMEMLADSGNGNYSYLDSVAEAEKVLVREAGGTLVTIAKDVKIQVEWNPNRVGAYRLIGYENRLLRARDFADDTKDAGEIGAGHSVTALYEIAPPGETPDVTPPLEYQEPPAPSGKAFGNEVLTLSLRYKEPDGTESRLIRAPVEDPGTVALAATSPDFRFSAAVAAFGLLLRDSEHRGEATYALVRDLAHGALGEDPHGDRRAFMELVETAARLKKPN